MTLVLSVNTPNTIWVCADRRLSAPGKKTIDDAKKMAFVHSDQEVAILAYSGLGMTAKGTHPSEWMKNTLRGLRLPLERLLDVLAHAMQEQLPRHLAKFPKNAAKRHTIMAPAFVGGQPRLYAIHMRLSADRKTFQFNYTRLVREPSTHPPRIAFAGSGELVLKSHTGWIRPLLRMVKAHDRNKLQAEPVADHFAAINFDVSERIPDKSVGPRCIVAWKYREGGTHNGGGGQQCYTGKQRDPIPKTLLQELIPTIIQGTDIRALIGLLQPQIQELMESADAGTPFEFDVDGINKEAKKLPNRPDRKLD